MTFRNRVTRFADFMTGLRDCAAAAEAGRQPDDRSLRAIGIDPGTVRRVHTR